VPDEDVPKVSFLSPVLNEEAHLEEMLRSLQAQSDDAWEVLLVDDGSTDGTAEIIERFAAEDPRFVAVSTGRRLGKVRAFNAAFAASRGEVVAIAGGDDVLTPNAVSARANALAGLPAGTRAAAFFRLRMFSEDPRFDGLVLPRGDRGSRSGPCLTITRALAQQLFPVPDDLPSEDIWLGEAAEDLATTVVESGEVVVGYRVHSGNSNPRHKGFAQMSESMGVRHEAWQRLLESELALSPGKRSRLEALWAAEVDRRAGRTIKVLRTPGLSFADRAAMAAMSHPALYAIRSRFYKAFSGRRGR
jgi:glycosyltransferase involved in cell wall biosynthesis